MNPDQPPSTDRPSEMTQIEQKYDEKTPPSIAITAAIAALENIHPTEVDLALHNYVPAEALDRIAHPENADAPVELTMTIEGYHIMIKNTGKILICGAET